MAEQGRPRQETMSSAERLGAVMMGQRPDRIPILPFAGGFCAKVIGIPIARIYDDPEKSFWAQIWTQELIGYDGGPMFGYASFGAWEFGGEIKMPSSEWEQAPIITKHPARTPEEVDALEIPDVETAGFYPMALEFARIQQQFGMPIQVMPIGGFTPAGNIAGLDKMCRWMVKQPEVAHKLLRKTVVFAKKVVDYYLDTFSPYPMSVMSGEASAANQIISPRQFEEFAFPYIKEMHEYYLERGLTSIFAHICGEQNLNLPHWRKLPWGPAPILSFGHEVDLTKAMEVFPDAVVAGNVEPRVIQEGTWQEVYELAKTCIERAKYHPRGYMLMAGCDVPPQAPVFNIYALKKAVMDFGFYD
ncbi:MAG TPA: uroporphyrinogen decarboxylase family protein [Anaerolineae bacterium]|nr:uroporphyrinogen decarboxylase family protein [Anaerolineae bacterium]